MPGSLLGGRNTRPLDPEQARRVINTFLGMDETAGRLARHDESRPTVFLVRTEEEERIAEIVFSADIYPGPNISNPNSALSMSAAVAHELQHYHRWIDLRELNDTNLKHIDEALTSLEAIQRYGVNRQNY